MSLNGQAGQFGLVDHRSPPSGWVVATSVATLALRRGADDPGFGFLVLCRRRDSNPQHADYDCARCIAGWCVLLRDFAARRPVSGVAAPSRLRAVSVASAGTLLAPSVWSQRRIDPLPASHVHAVAPVPIPAGPVVAAVIRPPAQPRCRGQRCALHDCQSAWSSGSARQNRRLPRRWQCCALGGCG